MTIVLNGETFEISEALANDIKELVTKTCANCGDRMRTVVRGHHHTENGLDVTR